LRVAKERMGGEGRGGERRGAARHPHNDESPTPAEFAVDARETGAHFNFEMTFRLLTC
jgi:hypothetical protein